MYGDTNMGANDEAVLTFLKTPMNKPIFDAFKAHVYPEFAKHFESPVPSATETVESAPAPAPAKKTTSKK